MKKISLIVISFNIICAVVLFTVSLELDLVPGYFISILIPLLTMVLCWSVWTDNSVCYDPYLIILCINSEGELVYRAVLKVKDHKVAIREVELFHHRWVETSLTQWMSVEDLGFMLWVK